MFANNKIVLVNNQICLHKYHASKFSFKSIVQIDPKRSKNNSLFSSYMAVVVNLIEYQSLKKKIKE